MEKQWLFQHTLKITDALGDKQMCYKCQTLQKCRYLLKILPSYIGTVCETPSPESNTIPVVLPEAYKDRTA